MENEYQLTEDQKCVLSELGAELMRNSAKESDAVLGYTVQLDKIQRAKSLCGGYADIMGFLVMLESATREKIADELNHSESLLDEYVEITGISPKED